MAQGHGGTPVKQYIRLFAVGCLMAAGLITGGCSNNNAPSPAGDPEPGELPEQELFHSSIRFYQDDRLSGILHAGQIRKFTRRSMVLLDSNVVMEFFDEQGRRTTVLTSDSGRADEVRRDMVAIGNVIATSDSGQTLETDMLRWENRTRRIISDTRVRLMTPTDTIDGVGFVSDEHLKNWQIMQPTGRSFREMERREPRPFLEPRESPATEDTLP